MGLLQGVTLFGKPLYDATKDSNLTIIIKSLIVIILCIGGIILPIMTDMGTIGTLICVFFVVTLSILILKNTDSKEK